MSNLNVNLDETASDCRGRIDDARAYLKGTDSKDAGEMNHKRGIIAAIEMIAITGFIISNLNEKDELNFSRFLALNREAREIGRELWSRYTLLLKQAPAAPVSQPPQERQQPITDGRRSKAGIPRHIFTDKEIDLMYELFDTVGTSAKLQEIYEIADQLGVGHSTVWNRFAVWRDETKHNRPISRASGRS